MHLFVSSSQEQYHDWIKLLEVVSKYRAYIEVSHLRPMVPVSEAPHLWWRYALQAGLQQKKLWYIHAIISLLFGNKESCTKIENFGRAAALFAFFSVILNILH